MRGKKISVIPRCLMFYEREKRQERWKVRALCSRLSILGPGSPTGGMECHLLEHWGGRTLALPLSPLWEDPAGRAPLWINTGQREGLSAAPRSLSAMHGVSREQLQTLTWPKVTDQGSATDSPRREKSDLTIGCLTTLDGRCAQVRPSEPGNATKLQSTPREWPGCG